jgi:hypothetical protein
MSFSRCKAQTDSESIGSDHCMNFSGQSASRSTNHGPILRPFATGRTGYSSWYTDHGNPADRALVAGAAIEPKPTITTRCRMEQSDLAASRRLLRVRSKRPGRRGAATSVKLASPQTGSQAQTTAFASAERYFDRN